MFSFHQLHQVEIEDAWGPNQAVVVLSVCTAVEFPGSGSTRFWSSPAHQSQVFGHFGIAHEFFQDILATDNVFPIELPAVVCQKDVDIVFAQKFYPFDEDT